MRAQRSSARPKARRGSARPARHVCTT
jgi:hypothetical protein